MDIVSSDVALQKKVTLKGGAQIILNKSNKKQLTIAYMIRMFFKSLIDPGISVIAAKKSDPDDG